MESSNVSLSVLLGVVVFVCFLSSPTESAGLASSDASDVKIRSKSLFLLHLIANRIVKRLKDTISFLHPFSLEIC
ncbi:unnamed protein product [Rodentolepis nana]|uniref:Secreted protein n=1 Tax=Rodentolepis nana TaxID=102285 RepID=A0A0R3TRA3_RODNA|nr:unnamed protein product [Rodentolepis nana]